MVQLLKQFLTAFGNGYQKQMLYLLAGALVAGLFETMGVILIFPFISLVANPDSLYHYPFVQLPFNWAGIYAVKYIVITIGIGVALIFILKNLYMMYFHYYQERVLAHWQNAIGYRMMQHYLAAPYTFHLNKTSSELMNMLNTVIPFATSGFVLQAIHLTSHVIVALCLIGLLLVQYFLPTLISAVVLTLLLFVQSRYFRRAALQLSGVFTDLRRKNFSALQQSFVAVKDTKMLLKEKFFSDRFFESNRRVTNNQRMISLYQQLPSMTTEIILILAIIIMSCLMLFRPSGVNIVADLAVIAAVGFRLAPLVNRSLSSYTQMNSARDPVQKLLEASHTLPHSENIYADDKQRILMPEKMIVLRHVDFTYPTKNVPVLQDINLSIHVGEFIGVVGRSGAGKTTLIDILMGLLTPQNGEYFIDDKKIGVDNIRYLRPAIGYVHQHIYMMEGSIRQNVAFGCDEKDIDDHKVIAALQKAQIYEFCTQLTDGLETKLGEGGKNLSGGQKQRIGIARALYHDPQVIVLDEATSALDVETEYAFTEAVNSLKGDKTIIAIAHRLSTLKQCDRIIYMDEGKVVDVDSFINLQQKHPAFARLVELSQLNFQTRTKTDSHSHL